jgi:hypothetical protein
MIPTDRTQDLPDDLKQLPQPPELVQDVLSERKQGNSTAKRAAAILVALKAGYIVPTAAQKKKIIIAFAKKDRIVYGRAYDIVRIADGTEIDLNDQDSIERHLTALTLYEIKSTNRKDLDSTFKGHFFALTTAELLVAQNLKNQFRFIFVNVRTGDHQDLTLREVLNRARGFYPQWSISF